MRNNAAPGMMTLNSPADYESLLATCPILFLPSNVFSTPDGYGFEVGPESGVDEVLVCMHYHINHGSIDIVSRSASVTIGFKQRANISPLFIIHLYKQVQMYDTGTGRKIELEHAYDGPEANITLVALAADGHSKGYKPHSAETRFELSGNNVSISKIPFTESYMDGMTRYKLLTPLVNMTLKAGDKIFHSCSFARITNFTEP